MAVFDGPGGTADQRVVEVVLLGLGDERLAGVGFERRDPPLLNRRCAVAEPLQERINIELSHR